MYIYIYIYITQGLRVELTIKKKVIIINNIAGRKSWETPEK